MAASNHRRVARHEQHNPPNQIDCTCEDGARRIPITTSSKTNCASTSEFTPPAQVAPDHPERGLGNWAGMSETELRQYLADRGYSGADIDDAAQLSREWATTMTNSSFFPAPPKPKLS